MLKDLSSRDFSKHLHTTFQVRIPGAAPLPLELIEVTVKSESSQMEQFFLIFRGPLVPHFPQSTYAFEHEKLGTLDLFTVPLGPDSKGMTYQVVFNRLLQLSR
jgi:hypothetical protein